MVIDLSVVIEESLVVVTPGNEDVFEVLSLSMVILASMIEVSLVGTGAVVVIGVPVVVGAFVVTGAPVTAASSVVIQNFYFFIIDRIICKR